MISVSVVNFIAKSAVGANLAFVKHLFELNSIHPCVVLVGFIAFQVSSSSLVLALFRGLPFVESFITDFLDRQVVFILQVILNLLKTFPTTTLVFLALRQLLDHFLLIT